MQPDVTLPLPQVVLFDVGGTLIETLGGSMSVAFAAKLDGAVSSADLDLAFTAVLSSARRSSPQSVEDHITEWSSTYRRVLEVLGLTRDVDAAVQAMWRVWLDDLVVFADARETLQLLLERGHRLGVISNWAPVLDDSLQRAGLRGFFEVVVCSTLVGCRKPAREIFDVAVRRMDVAPGDCVYIGDDYALDVEGAVAAGMEPVLLDRNAVAMGVPTGARVIHSLSDLVR